MTDERLNQFGMTDADTKKRLKVLKASYEMYERSLKETERELKHKTDKHGKKIYTKEKIDETLNSIRNAENDVIDEYLMLGGKESDLKHNLKRYTSNGQDFEMHDMPIIVDKETDNSSNIMEKLKNVGNTQKSIEIPNKKQNTTVKMAKKTETKKETENNTVKKVEPSKNIYDKVNEVNVQYVNYEHDNGFDLIPLPSKGECYANKLSKIAVAPLCGYDEDMIMAPNLYSDGLILDMLLRAKIIDKTIDPMDLLDGDREAILLWLRSDGYGPEYSVSAKDKKTGQSFDTKVDLSKLKYKPFELKSDNYGWFDYTLPRGGNHIKFRFLKHREVSSLDKLEEYEAKGTIKSRLATFVATMDNFVEASGDYDDSILTRARKAIRDIEAWGDSIEEDDAINFTHSITNRLEMEVMAVDGETDRDFIHEFVQNMSAMDSKSLREYIAMNEPGVDYHFTVEKPESLGGGSQEVFLRFDKYLFLNNK